MDDMMFSWVTEAGLYEGIGHDGESTCQSLVARVRSGVGHTRQFYPIDDSSRREAARQSRGHFVHEECVRS